MKTLRTTTHLALTVAAIFILTQCGDRTQSSRGGDGKSGDPQPTAGQSAVKDDQSQKDVVKVAVGSPDHSTLVKAVQIAEYVDVLSNAGPFTVFAPTNAAFDKLPAGTLETLTKPENKAQLRDILEYHVAVASYKPEMLRDGMSLGMANGGSIEIANKDGKIIVNGNATVVATVPASNGIFHVIDGVLLPPGK
ncbi:MAG: fasciclin domain-containing protein [Verrucomicrobiales bacterium]|nr:fasciclin domain-containing protein [Verrucomicrobiales bacterium]